jgi:hypothetical protein
VDLVPLAAFEKNADVGPVEVKFCSAHLAPLHFAIRLEAVADALQLLGNKRDGVAI